jgi:hypothetical protein
MALRTLSTPIKANDALSTCVPYHSCSAEAMLLGGGVPVAMLGAYLDDSSDDRREHYFSFGGIVGDVRQVDLFTLLWIDATYGLKQPFRSTDCESGYGQFKNWPKSDRDVLMAKLVTLIRNRGMWGFASIVSVADYRSIFPAAELYDPFYLCVKSAIAQLGFIANTAGQDISICGSKRVITTKRSGPSIRSSKPSLHGGTGSGYLESPRETNASFRFKALTFWREKPISIFTTKVSGQIASRLLD